jgi:hypothetical protein
MREFKEVFYPFETKESCVEHIAQMFACGIIANDSFVEGYGYTKDFGVRCKTEDDEVETEGEENDGY